MRDFDLNGRTFDTITVAMNSVLHQHNIEDFRGFFRSAARHLSQNGRLVFGLCVATVVHDTLGIVTVEETVKYDLVDQVSHSDWFWSAEGKKDFWRMPLQMRASGSLRLIERFGDFDRSPLTIGSRRQLCLCALA